MARLVVVVGGQQREESLWRESGVGEGYVMTWKSQPVGHAGLCGSMSGSKALEPGHLLPGTGSSQDSRNEPVTDSIACNKPNTVGKMRCCTEDAAVSMPSPVLPPSPLLMFINPNIFLLGQRETNPIPFYQ